MDLFKPFYMKVPEGREEIDKACAKVERITDGKKLVKIAIRAPHESIREQALEAIKGDEALASVTIPGSVTSVEEYAFHGCDALTDVYYGGTETQKSSKISPPPVGGEVLPLREP